MDPDGRLDVPDAQQAAPPAPAPSGTGARRGRPRTASLLMCAIGSLLVGAAGALVHLQPAPAGAGAPAGVAAPAALPGPPAAAVTTEQPTPTTTASLPVPASAQARARVRRASVDAEAAPPRSVQIPAAGVDSRLVPLRRQRDGALEVPADFALAGWYRDGVRPGDRGPAVLVGHVDSYDGPAVFFGLKDLRRDDKVTVTRTDGSAVVFAVYARETVGKDDFPTSRVYGDTDQPELRLLTCGGPFDAETKHYRDNVVVYARQIKR